MNELKTEGIPFYIVDVFAEGKYSGNQLAVVISRNKLNDEEMQRIAKEMNYSETSFITSVENYDVRIFTPEVELPFAGHPTIGTAYILQQEFMKEKAKTMSLNLKIGNIAILFKYKGEILSETWMEHKEPTFSGFFVPDLIADVLCIDENDIDDRFKIQEVSTGIPTIIVPLKSLDIIKKVSVNNEKYIQLIKNTQAKSILVFCPETYDKRNDLNVRFFADYYGVPEDPATGSANGCLAAYLVKHDYFGKKNIEIRVEQGYEIGRKSLLLLKAEEKAGKFYITVGGKVILVAKGTLL
ncbi:MAG: PhzF family phenazine biosynthesis protein [Candidatus Lokiarchaeota archaeon]|nr:PhzF family phenazine biosynthesis protein [Candidatus Lokiarchaeota archaeon]